MQISGETVGEVRPVADMHQRKAEMARQSDAFIALPGEHHAVFTTCSTSRSWIVSHDDPGEKDTRFFCILVLRLRLRLGRQVYVGQWYHCTVCLDAWYTVA